MLTHNTEKRLQLLVKTEAIILASLRACRAEISMLEGSISPDLPTFTRSRPAFTHHRELT